MTHTPRYHYAGCMFDIHSQVEGEDGMTVGHVRRNAWTRYARSLSWWRWSTYHFFSTRLTGRWTPRFICCSTKTVCASWGALFYRAAGIWRSLRPLPLPGGKPTSLRRQQCRTGGENTTGLPSNYLPIAEKERDVGIRRQWRVRLEYYLQSYRRSVGWAGMAKSTPEILSRENICSMKKNKIVGG